MTYNEFIQNILEIQKCSYKNLYSNEKKCNFCEYRFMCEKMNAEN